MNVIEIPVDTTDCSTQLWHDSDWFAPRSTLRFRAFTFLLLFVLLFGRGRFRPGLGRGDRHFLVLFLLPRCCFGFFSQFTISRSQSLENHQRTIRTSRKMFCQTVIMHIVSSAFTGEVWLGRVWQDSNLKRRVWQAWQGSKKLSPFGHNNVFSKQQFKQRVWPGRVWQGQTSERRVWQKCSHTLKGCDKDTMIMQSTAIIFFFWVTISTARNGERLLLLFRTALVRWRVTIAVLLNINEQSVDRVRVAWNLLIRRYSLLYLGFQDQIVKK